LVIERMIGQVVKVDISPNHFPGPVDERMDPEESIIVLHDKPKS
jgi:hypothetical protein